MSTAKHIHTYTYAHTKYKKKHAYTHAQNSNTNMKLIATTKNENFRKMIKYTGNKNKNAKLICKFH